MRRDSHRLATLFLAALFCGVLIGCQSAVEEDTGAVNEEELAALEAEKVDLDGLRAELAGVEDQIARLEVGESLEAAEGEEPPTVETLTARASELSNDVTNLTEDIGSRLATWINEAGITQGAELTDPQTRAFRLKSALDAAIAEEFIQKGGDYSRAIRIYSQALTIDPDNEDLKTALAAAEANQHMTEERFAVVKKGMNPYEVRQALGQVNLSNIKEYQEGAVRAWFYRKADGGAAGVFFRQEKGWWKSYEIDFNAAPAPTAEEG